MRSQEAQELIISWLTISIAFSYYGGKLANIGNFFHVLPISLVAVGTGFIFHELAHRAVARHYGCYAEFRMWTLGLVLALVLAITFNFVFAAPGAVYIYGPNLSRKQNAKISLAGPLTNILVAIIFFAIFFLTGSNANTYLGLLLSNVALINLWFAFFNLLPMWPLDGSKIIAYYPWLWVILFLPLLALFFGIPFLL